jgi:lipopolysaccharide export system protein LptC
MRERLASLMAILLLGLVTATSYWYSRSLNLDTSGRHTPPPRMDADADVITLVQFDRQGRAQYRLTADRMSHFADTDDVELAQPRLLSLRADEPGVHAQARTARVENNGERVRLGGNVVLTRQTRDARPPLVVTTESLLAIPDWDRYLTDQPVQVQWGRNSIHAHGMDLDNVAQRVEFASDVTNRISPEHRK